MTSQVLYRKWRPRRFSDLAGQEHVTTVLRQAVIQDRISHAYLFCGPRGTGKTTTARVLARTLSCLNPRDGEPDTTCALCQNIDAGRAMDLIEMDAASNRGIDEIRSIRDRVNFSPVESKYKVYIVDEAHMLTEAASNAFLKTLEEPPPTLSSSSAPPNPTKSSPPSSPAASASTSAASPPRPSSNASASSASRKASKPTLTSSAPSPEPQAAASATPKISWSRS